MLKYFIIGSIFASSVFFGVSLSSRLKKRAYCIGLLSQMLCEIAVRIRYIAPTFEEIVRLISENDRYNDLDFPKRIIYLTEEIDIRNAWKKAINESSLPLTKDDMKIMLNVGDFLGTSDLSGQLSMLEIQISALNTEQENAVKEYERKGKMYRSVSVLVGLGACIMLF